MTGEDKILDKLGEIDVRLSGIDNRLIGVDERLSGMGERLTGMDERLTVTESSQSKVITKLIEMDAYLHEKVATKDELHEVKTEIMTHIDGFAKKQEIFDHELVSARSRMDRIEGKA